jgi:D-3-phosphoglycerate dehydrogenase
LELAVFLENKTLVLDLLEWIDSTPRTYVEVMDAWRTSCPRLPIWEDAVAHGFVVTERQPGRDATVVLTSGGRSFLDRQRPLSLPAAARDPSSR